MQTLSTEAVNTNLMMFGFLGIEPESTVKKADSPSTRPEFSSGTEEHRFLEGTTNGLLEIELHTETQ